MHQVAEDVWQIPLLPRNGVNAYLLGDVVVDAGIKGHAKKVIRAVAGRTVSAHAITHAHGDHVGGSRRVVDALGVPFWCPAGDAADVEAGRQTIAESPIKPLMKAGAKFDSVPIARRLAEGDEIGAGFVVLDTPGHSPGHVSFWRERDRVLVCADVFFNLNFATLQPGLRQPIKAFTVDPAMNRASERRLAALRPELTLFGHGPALRDPAALERFVAALPAN
ncbi:MAG: beta-lactamase domain protein [Solirubrobacteraceae bacterium]|nr:beta-lactamase domain protein [Solirubrobacteraceae bacterium]